MSHISNKHTQRKFHQWTSIRKEYNPDPRDNDRSAAVIPHAEKIARAEVPAYRRKGFRQLYFVGTKFTLRFFAVVACATLITNISWLGYAIAKYGIVDGLGTIATGSCGPVKAMGIWFHLLINILSTLLLTGSNAFMAAYSSPTREELDKSHSRRRWMHVGSMSFRNMSGIARTKSLVCLALAISSVPFHLLYNSLVFTSLGANNYTWVIGTEGYITGAPFNITKEISIDAGIYPFGAKNNDYFTHIQNEARNWERLDQQACINAYADSFLSDRRDVVLITSASNEQSSLVGYGTAEIDSELDNNWWICSETGPIGHHVGFDPSSCVYNASSWTVWRHPIEYCLSERVESNCSLRFNLPIMVIVVAFNALKVMAMVWILFRLDASMLLTSVGDAAASFIRRPDPTTAGLCLSNVRTIDQDWHMPVVRKYRVEKTYRLLNSISNLRWGLFSLLMLFSWLLVAIFGVWGYAHVLSRSETASKLSPFQLGFGAVSQNALILYGGWNPDAAHTIATALIANVPQVFLATVYLMYMGIMTTMFNVREWARFSKEGQNLIVGSPAGEQRGTWLLGAPWKYGITLLILQTFLHWFVSQSLFVVEMTVYNPLGQAVKAGALSGGSFTNCGYSPIAMICAVVTSGVLYLSAIIFGFLRTSKCTPPIVSTCSAAISAACHVPLPLLNDATEYGNLRWGATANSLNGVGHCSLGPAEAWNRGDAGDPISGKPYAGLSEGVSRSAY